MSEKKKPSILKLLIGNVLMLSVLLFVSECSYRGVLNGQAAKPAVPYYFFATSESMLAYDAELGYRYLPNHTSHTAIVKQGKVVRLYTNRVSSAGTTSAEGVFDPDADTQILAVGDSFTGLTYSDRPWPDAMHDALETDETPVSVFNGGQDGYGLLQIVHAARVHAERSSFDHVVIGFITDDLTRGRFWRYHLPEENPPRVVTSILNDPAALEAPYVDTFLLESRVTPEWAESLMQMEDQSGDPILSDLLNRAESWKREAITLPRFGGGYSVILNKLLWKDPYHTLNQRGRNPRLAIHSYEADTAFMEDLAALRESGVRISAFHIPTHTEIQEGRYTETPQTASLLASFEEALGKPAVKLLPLVNIQPDQIDQFFLEPHDHHPNAAGMTRIGESIADWLKQNPESGN